MNRRDIVIGLLIFAAVAGLLYWRNKQANSDMKVPEEMSSTDSTAQKMEDKFNVSLPSDADKAELTGEGDGTGIATRKVTDGKTDVAILADLPEPETGRTYEAWLEKDDSNKIKLGSFRVAKGGYILEQTLSQDTEGYNTVVISSEKTRDNTIEQTVLKGNF